MTPEEIVLSAILPDRLDLLGITLSRLQPRHFEDPTNRDLFTIMRMYYERTGAIIPSHMVERVLQASRWPAAKRIATEEQHKTLTATHTNAPDARWAIEQLRQDAAHRDTNAALAEAREILEVGWSDPEKTAGKTLTGHEDARTYVYTQLHAIERSMDGESVPEGDMRLDARSALDDYARRKAGKLEQGVGTGLACIDAHLGGLMDGELTLLVAYTGQGKSHLVTQTAWHVSTQLGRDVFFATSETIRKQVMRRVWSRHSRLPQFQTPGGINAKDIRNGSLSPAHEVVFQAVLDDLHKNPAYGKLHVAQLPPQATVGHIETRLREFGRQARDPAICVIDYLALLKASTKRGSKREEYDEIINDAKHMATTFMSGRGIPVLSPWSVSQTAYEKAVQKHAYGMASLAETSVAEKSADTIVALIREEDDTQGARLQFMKVRDGDLPPTAELAIDFRCSFAADREAFDTFGTTASDPLADLDL